MAALKTETKVIGGIPVSITQFASTRGGRLSVRLLKILAPAIAAAPKALLEADKLLAMEVEAIAPVIVALCEHADEKEVDALRRDLLENARAEVDGKLVPLNSDATVDAVFGADQMSMWAAVGFSLQVNFTGFFVGASSLASPAKAPVTGNSSNSTTP